MAQSDVSERLVVENLGLIQHIVSSLSTRYPRHVDRNDLWNAGALGLVEAAQRYDSTVGIPFARYAAIRIRGAIIDSTRSRDWATRSVRRDLRAIRMTEEDMRARGTEPVDEEIAKALDMSVGDLRKRRADEVSSTLLYLDRENDDDDNSLRQRVVDPSTATRPDTALESRELIGTLAEAVEHLPEPQREVVARYYLDGDLMRDIAEDLGITEARVSQIRSEALASMRSFFSTLYEEVEPADNAGPGKRARTRYLESMEEGSNWKSRLEAADSKIRV
jgi:RNA polymerase sigma factor for flagellar operon FliA